MAKYQVPFRYTGAVQTWTVPDGVTSVVMECYGATGGGGDSSSASTPSDFDGGAMSYAELSGWATHDGLNKGSNMSGYVSGTLAVTPGVTYQVYVGGNGHNGVYSQAVGKVTTSYGAGGWNGGGRGGYGGAPNNSGAGGWSQTGAGGGGATDVRTGSALSTRIMVAGGAGGAGGNVDNTFGAVMKSPRVFTRTPTSPTPPYAIYNQTYYELYISDGGGYGGTAGGRGGQATGPGGSALSASYGTGGGTVQGGTGGVNSQVSSIATNSGGVAGTLGVGGRGGDGNVAAANYYAANGDAIDCGVWGGGGGGGGYYGGGGGAVGGRTDGVGGGGGGGSNYISSSFTDTVNLGRAAPYLHYDNPSLDQANTPTTLWNDIMLHEGDGGFARFSFTQAPSAPIFTAPDSVKVNSTFAVSWLHQPAGGVTTSGGGEDHASADIRWSHDGATWTQQHLGLSSATSQGQFSYTVPASATTVVGTLYVEVRTVDQDGDISPWTEAFVSIVSQPATPTWVAPANGSVVSSQPFSLTASNPNTDLDAVNFPQGHRAILWRYHVTEPGLQSDKGHLAPSRINLSPNPLMSVADTTNLWIEGGGTKVNSSAYTDPFSGTSQPLLATFGAGPNAQLGVDAGKSFYLSDVPSNMFYNLSLYARKPTSGTSVNTFQFLVVAPNGDEVVRTGTFTLTTSWQRFGAWFSAPDLPGATNYKTYLVPDGGAPVSGAAVVLSGLQIDLTDTLGILNVRPFFGGAFGGAASTVEHDAALTGMTYAKAPNGLFYAYPTAGGTDTFTSTASGWSSGTMSADAAVWTLDRNVGSDLAHTSFTLNISPPGPVNATILADDINGTVSLHITTADKTNTVSYAVFRSPAPGGVPDFTQEVKVATLAPDAVDGHADWTDYSPATGVTYQYRVRAYSSAGGYSEVL